MNKLLVVLLTSVATIGTANGTLSIPSQGSWAMSLQGRDLNADSVMDVYYDVERDITWLANTWGGAGSIYDDPGGAGGTTDDGHMTWQHAMDWASSLNVHGVVGWRLPNMVDLGEPGCTQVDTSCTYDADPETSEAAHMFLQILGNIATYDTSRHFQANSGLTNAGPFSYDWPNRYGHDLIYWTSLTYSPDPDYAWVFSFTHGYQDWHDKDAAFYAWAVRDGDVSTTSVPEPAALPLMLTGLATLGFAMRRRRAN